MSTITPKPYYQLNRQTGRWQLIQPEAISLSAGNFKRTMRKMSAKKVDSAKAKITNLFKENPSLKISVPDILTMVPCAGDRVRYVLAELKRIGMIRKADRVEIENKKFYTYQLRQA
jgi:hypothetical protein